MWAFLLLGCNDGTGREHWADQLQPTAPCWQVRLSDGLDEQSANELHALFDCLNQRQELDDFAWVDESLDQPSRSPLPLGAELGRSINQATASDVEFLDASGTLLQIIEEDSLLPDYMHIVAELIHGETWSDLTSESSDITPAHEGPISAGLSALPMIAASDLDHSTDLLGRLGQTMQSETTTSLTCSLVALNDVSDQQLQAVNATLVHDLGDLLQATVSPENDIWAGASGHSLRDLVEALTLPSNSPGESALQQLLPHLQTMLNDAALQYQLKDALLSAHENGHLQAMPSQLQALASQDVEGRNLTSGEDSAWVSLIRLLARGNTDVACSIDLWLIELEFELGNFSVAILTELASRDPDNMASGVSLLGNVLGATLSQVTLDAIASSGVCPILDEQMVEDLQSIDRLDDDDMGDFLVVLLNTLSAFHDAGSDDALVAEFVDTITILYESSEGGASQELFRDIGGSALAENAMVLVGLLLDPSPLSHHSCPDGAQPLNFDELWDQANSLVQNTLDGAGASGLQPTVETIVQQDSLWLALERLASLLANPESVIGTAHHLLADSISNLDENDTAILSELLQQPDVTTPLLHVLENETWTAAWLTQQGPTGGPMAYLSHLIRSGTLEAVLEQTQRLIDLARESVEEDNP